MLAMSSSSWFCGPRFVSDMRAGLGAASLDLVEARGGAVLTVASPFPGPLTPLAVFGALGLGFCLVKLRIDMVGFGSLLTVDGFSELDRKRS